MSEFFFVKIATFSFFSMNSQWIGKYDALLESSFHFQLIAVPGKKKYLMLTWISKTDQCSSCDARMAIGCQMWWQINKNLKKIFLIRGWSEAEGFYLKIVPNCLIYGQSSADLWTIICNGIYYWNPKGKVSSCKIDGFTATYIPELKWAWQA